jgi:hypothetical protein
MERKSSEKHEYYKGEIFRMHGHGELLAMSDAEIAITKYFPTFFLLLETN